MGVVGDLELGRRQQEGAVDAVGHAHRAHAQVLHALQDAGHSRFEVEAVPEDGVGRFEPRDVALAGPVEVRIDARAHEGLNVHRVAADPPNGVGDLPDRGHDTQRTFGNANRPEPSPSARRCRRLAAGPLPLDRPTMHGASVLEQLSTEARDPREWRRHPMVSWTESLSQ